MPSASRVRGRPAHGGVLLVPVKVQGQDFELLVDTGSAYTALSRDLLGLLGIAIDPQRTAAIAPAHGRIIKVPLITVAELSIGGFRTPDVEAIVLAKLRLKPTRGAMACSGIMIWFKSKLDSFVKISAYEAG